MIDGEPIIEVRDFSYAIGGKRILDRVTLDVRRGEYLSVIGPNGAGKTTLLKCMDRILSGGTGSVSIGGRPLAEHSQKALARIVAYVPQADGRYAPFTVREFVTMGRYPHLSPFTSIGSTDRAAVDRALEMTDTARFADRRHSSLSGGEAQKVHIAAALAQEAEVLLLDEPTTFLDPHHQEEIGAILARVNRASGTTIVAVTHDVNRAALSSTRIVALKAGRIVYAGSPRGVMTGDVLAALYDKTFLFASHPRTGTPMIVPDTGDHDDAT